MYPYRIQDPMYLYGHRGAKAEAPENTLAGFEHLRSLGIHRVELDIRLSLDDELIVLHDHTLDRTTNGSGDIRKHHSNELAALDARKTHPQWPKATGVPTLKQVLANWPELESIQLEVKATKAPMLRIIAHKLHDLIAELEIEEQAIITSAHKGFLQLSRKLSQAQTSYIAHGFVAERFCRNPLGIIRRLRCQYLCANYKLLTPKLVKQAHQYEVFVSAWTVNTIEEAEQLASMHVDSIITDAPSLFL
ncbi:MAG: glycerophosphodiester phosphodiesterase [Pseudomonadales bacterium]|nr:glycerophosphodiester phosphodiesterase [Pseudomonadales bacterium]